MAPSGQIQEHPPRPRDKQGIAQRARLAARNADPLRARRAHIAHC